MQKPEVPEENAPRKNPTDRNPWPMWPIALAIAVFIGAYTYINVSHRKEGAAYEPHQAMNDRRDKIVEKNIYDWYRIKTALDSNLTLNANEVEKTLRPYSGALEQILPEQLVYYIPSRPVLVDGPLAINSDAAITQGEPFTIRIELPSGIATDERFHLQAFYKEGSFHLMPSFFIEDIAEAADVLATEPKQLQFSIPTDPVGSEEVSIVLYAEGYVHEWKVPSTPKPIEESADSTGDES